MSDLDPIYKDKHVIWKDVNEDAVITQEIVEHLYQEKEHTYELNVEN